MPHAAEVYRRLAPAVLGYFRAQRIDDPEDVLGDVFLQVARDIGKFKGDDDDLRRWVFSIAHNRLVDARRRAARRPVLVDGEVPERPAPAAIDEIDPALVAALDALTADQREVVVLRFIADLSIESVAQITRSGTGAVKSLQHRGLERLAKAMNAVADPAEEIPG